MIEMKNITKRYPGVVALDNIRLQVRKGEVHALLGENGAGKSTLIKVLTGVEEFETGQIMIDGKDKPIINHSPQEAQSNRLCNVCVYI